MPPIRVGIVGAGVIAIDVHVPLMLEMPEKYQVVAIADPKREAAERGAAQLPERPRLYASHEELLQDSDVDAVLVAVPPYLGVPIGVDALASGRHVMVEKPMGNSAEDAQRLLDASRNSKGKLMVAEQFFFAPGFVKLREMARTGDWPFGEPLLVQLHQFWKMTEKTIPQFYHSPWRHDKRLTYGYLIEGGCHTANPIREAFGMPGQITSRLLCADPKLGRHDTLIAQGTFESGLAFQITTSYGMRTLNKAQLQIFSRGGTISVKHDHLELLAEDGSTSRIETPFEHRKHDYRAEWLHFYDVVANGAAQLFTPEQAYGDIVFMQRLIDAGLAAKVS